MRSLIVDIYKVMYKLTGSKLFAMVFGLVYMTLFNLVIVYGIGLLMEGWLPIMSIVHRLFALPLIAVTAVAVFGITYKITPTIPVITKELKKPSSMAPLIIYTVFGVLLFVYIRMGDKLF